MTNTVVNTITDFIPDCTPLVDVDDFHLAPLNFSISPNPTEGNVWIHLETRLENVQISVVHLNGKEIFQKNENAIFDAYRLDLKNIGKGIYFLKIQSENFVGLTKVIKIK